MPSAHPPAIPPPIDPRAAVRRRGRVTGSCRRGRVRPEAAVCETVFRYQLQHRLVDHPPCPRYYLALQGQDPDAPLLARLRELTPWIQPLSQCQVTARDGVRDRVTGGRGVIVQVARLTWVHAAAVDVVGGYYLTHRHAAGFCYRVEPHELHWAVTRVHLLWRA